MSFVTRIRIAIFVSLLLHLAGIGAVAYWGAAAAATRVRFGGDRQVLQLDLVFMDVSLQTEQAALEIQPADQDIVITPQRATISRRTYQATPTRDVALAEMVLPAVERQDLAREPRDVRRPLSEPKTFDTVEPHAVVPLPRQRLAPSFQMATAAQLPQSAGTDKQRSPDFRGNAPPTYPEIARQRRWQGVVLLRLHILEDGRVDLVEVARSSGYSVLDAAAVNAVKRWRGEPGLDRDGRAVATVELLPVEFRLQ